MNTLDAMVWFKATFGEEISELIKETPFTLDMVAAIAYQETGFIWGKLAGKRDVNEILKLCVGDTLDAPNRSAFPKNREKLEEVANGKQMFTIAREALADAGSINPQYQRIFSSNQNKFCHGYGIFQYDLQHFKTDPQYFLNKKWRIFSESLGKLLLELNSKLKRVYGAGKTSLTHNEMVYVAIAYNRGSTKFDPRFKEGYKDSSGKYYGEYIHEYINIAAQAPNPQPQQIAVGTTRLIFAKHLEGSATDFIYKASTTASLINNQFQVDKSELEAFLGIAFQGPSRASIRHILTQNNRGFTPSFAHQNDPENPRVYIFIESIP